MSINDDRRAFFLKALSLTESKLSTKDLAIRYYKFKLGLT